MVKHCTQCGEPQEEGARFCAKCGTPAVTAAGQDPLVGKVIADRYLLVEKVGSGGSGTIYRGEHTTLRKKVAVKILHSSLSQDEHAIERFRREATTVAEIDNEHILQVIDFGRTDDKRLFFAMEYLEGETLTRLLERDGKMAPARVVDILVQIGEALMEAHGLGYIHRDLRPRNVFLTTKKQRTDFVKLLDFGLAKLILPSVEAKQTAMGMTFGDPRYMSPEQARGETVDRRADIYSLGVIAYEMLTGEPPYPGKTFDVLQQHLDAPVPQVRAKRPDCPEWLDAVVQRALAKKPEQRFLTVLKMIECLRAQQAPGSTDEAEQQEHARLTATAQIKAVGDLFASSGAPSTSAKETQAIGTRQERKAEAQAAPVAAQPAPVAAQPAPQPVAAAPAPAKPPQSALAAAASAPVVQPMPTSDSGPIKTGRKDTAQALARAVHTPPPMPAVLPSSAAGAVNASNAAGPSVENVPSVVVDAGTPSPERSAPMSDDSKTIPMLKAAPPPPGGSKSADSTGEWFSDSGKFDQVARAPGGTFEDDEEFAPKKSRSGLIIGGVAGGLTLVMTVVLLLLPKAEHKPIRGESEAEKPAVTAAPAPTPAAPAPPTPAAATPAPATPAPAVTPAPAPAVAAAPAPTPTAPAAVAPTPEPPKPVVAEQPKPEPPKPVVAEPKPPKPVVAEAPKPPKPAKAEKAEKPVKIASAERKGSKELPTGFKDPFAEPSSKPTQTSAQAEFFVKLGRQKLNASDLTAASANFNKAREYDAKSPDAYAGLGEVSFEQGDYNAAKVNLLQALRLSPNRPRYLVLLGQTYYKLGRAKDAVGEYRKALKIDPNNAEAQHSLDVAERKLAQQGG